MCTRTSCYFKDDNHLLNEKEDLIIMHVYFLKIYTICDSIHVVMCCT